MKRPKVSVVGGGLAGMVAAWRLLERGCDVTVYEASGRWGGKAGATNHERRMEEHGYHIFPAWYRNVWKLVDELGIGEHFRDCSNFAQIRPGAYPEFLAFTNITSARYVWKNLTSGVLPFAESFLFFYAALDLMSQPYRYRAKLDEVSVTGFLRSRFYRTERVAQQFEELMLKGISVPTYEVSAMTMRNVTRYWVRSPEPMHRILKGDLQTLWIEPIRAKIETLGGSLRLAQKLVKIDISGGRISGLHFSDAEGNVRLESVDQVLLAIPAEKLGALIGDTLYAATPELADVRRLRARPMAAFNVYFKQRIDGVPPDHVNLLDSRFGISFIDVSQTWPGEHRTVLNLIASDFTDLEPLSPQVAIAVLMDDLRRYLPTFGPDDVDLITYQPHLNEPLFMNNVGGWTFRPESRTQIPNLYLAGDFARSHIDLVSMEGAVSTGLLAAEALRANLGLGLPIEITVPPTYPEWLLKLGRFALMPLAALAKGWTDLTQTPYDPSVADIPPFDVEMLATWPLVVVNESSPGREATVRERHPSARSRVGA